MYVISERQAAKLVSFSEAIEAVDEAFRLYSRGEAQLLPVVLGHAPDGVSRFGAKSGTLGSDVVGVKCGTYWPGNRARALPSHSSVVLLLDSQTGMPAALVGAGYLAGQRTAAADAVAVRRLARPDARVLALVGAGHQAIMEAIAISHVRDLDRILVWSRSAGTVENAIADMAQAGLRATAAGLEEAVRAADIVVTATTSTEPLVMADWVSPGTHVSAMGADAAGKQELDVALVRRARLFADVAVQTATIGEFQHVIAADIVKIEDIALLGDVLTGQHDGRRSPDEITIFDSSGTAFQDLAICNKALEIARCGGVGTEIDWYDGH
jgi:ornithine cyclodeaminase